MRGQRQRGCLGQLLHPPLGGAIGRDRGDRHDRVDRGHVDDRPLYVCGDHALGRALGRGKNRAQVQPDHRVEIGQIIAEEIARFGDARVVHQRGNRAFLGLDPVEQGQKRVRVGHIADETAPADTGCGGGHAVFHIHQHHAVAIGSQRPPTSQPDALRAAGYQGDGLIGHVKSFCRVLRATLRCAANSVNSQAPRSEN